MASAAALQLELALPLISRRERERGGQVIDLELARIESILARRGFSPHHRPAAARPRERERPQVPELPDDSVDDLWR